MTNEAKASWVFGALFAIFVLCVFIFGPPSLPGYKQQILAYICALLAGFFAAFFTGTLLLNTQLPIPGKWVVSGGAGFALFLIVLFWWKSGAAPIAAEVIPPSTNKETTTVGSKPREAIPPVVTGGAPIGTDYQYRFTKNGQECIGEYVKVSGTDWQERNSSDGPPGCQVDAIIFKYTERQSSDRQYFLLYDEGRDLFARLADTPVGQTSPTDWRLVSSSGWNVVHSVTRTK